MLPCAVGEIQAWSYSSIGGCDILSIGNSADISLPVIVWIVIYLLPLGSSLRATIRPQSIFPQQTDG